MRAGISLGTAAALAAREPPRRVDRAAPRQRPSNGEPRRRGANRARAYRRRKRQVHVRRGAAPPTPETAGGAFRLSDAPRVAAPRPAFHSRTRSQSAQGCLGLQICPGCKFRRVCKNARCSPALPCPLLYSARAWLAALTRGAAGPERHTSRRLNRAPGRYTYGVTKRATASHVVLPGPSQPFRCPYFCAVRVIIRRPCASR